ncbi:MAG: FG-GAP-like repeat-containing protein [Candidatus Eisenbacteria bacterium]
MQLPRWLCGVLPVLLFLLVVPTTQSATAQIYWIEAPEFAPPWTGHTPEFGDLDGDGDYDLIYAVVTQSYRNVGSPSLPSWQQDDSLVDGVEYVGSMTTCLADLDADGDLDLSVGMLYGEACPLFYYENVGSATQPVWQQQNSMYESLSPGAWTCPELADLDDDGDLDLLLAVEWGLRAYRNTGTAELPSWIRDDGLADGISLPYPCSDPNLGDLDGDGDLDLVIGGRSYGSPIMCYENSGSTQNPTWVENESMLTGVERDVECLGLDLADLDGDGDLDMLSCQSENGRVIHLNQGSVTPVEPSSWGRIKELFR